MTPSNGMAMGQLSRELGSDTVVPIPGYGDLETIDFGADNATMREAVAASPLPPMPLAVLAHGKPIISLAETRGFTTAEWEALQQTGFENLATLVPQARFSVASESGHDIHQDQPELVIDAIRQWSRACATRTPVRLFSVAQNDRIVIRCMRISDARNWISTNHAVHRGVFQQADHFGNHSHVFPLDRCDLGSR